MSTADYVIVGTGSAGCVPANRLTADPSVRVHLIEAGGKDHSPNIKIPAAFANQFHTKLDWDYATEPEPHVDRRELYIPRGKSLLGCGCSGRALRKPSRATRTPAACAPPTAAHPGRSDTGQRAANRIRRTPRRRSITRAPSPHRAKSVT